MKSAFLTSVAAAALLAGSSIATAQNSNEQRQGLIPNDVKSQSIPERSPQQTQSQDSSRTESRTPERNEQQETPSAQRNPVTTQDSRSTEPRKDEPASRSQADRESDRKRSTGQSSSDNKDQPDKGTQQQSGQAKDLNEKAQRDSEGSRTGSTSRQNQSSGQASQEGRSQQSPSNPASAATNRNATETRQGTAVQGRDVGVTLTAEQRTRVRESVLSRSDAPRIENVNFSINVGIAVPERVRVVEVPPALIEIHPEWRNHSYFIVRDEIVIVDRSRKIVAVVDSGSSRAQRSVGSTVAVDLPPDDIKQIQLVLIERRFYDGEADGVWGPRTRDALIRFQRERGFEATGTIDTRTVTELGLSGKVTVSGASSETTSTTSSTSPSAGTEGSETSQGTTGQQPAQEGTATRAGPAAQSSGPSNAAPGNAHPGEKMRDIPQSGASPGSTSK